MTIDSAPAAGNVLSQAQQEAVRHLLASATAGLTAAAPSDTIPPAPASDLHPMTSSQRSMWIVDGFLDDNTAYGVHRALWLRGALDEAALEGSLAALVRRHRVLGATFHADGQRIPAPGDLPDSPLTVVQAPGQTVSDRRQWALAAAAAERSTPFELDRGPVFRAILYRVSAEEHLLLTAMHHIVSDAWSDGLLAREIAAGYAARRGRARPDTGTPVRGGAPVEGDPPEPRIQFHDYAAWQSRRLAAGLGQEQLGYWMRALAGIEALDLQTDHPRPVRPSLRGRTTSRTLDSRAAQALGVLAAARGATMSSVVLAAYSCVLSRFSGRHRFAIGSMVAGRDRVETEGLIGLFANTVALPVDLTGDPRAAEAVERAHAALLGALDHQDVGFDQVASRFGAARDAARGGLFDVLFSYAEAVDERWDLPGLAVEPVADLMTTPAAKADLELTAVHGPDSLSLTLTWAEDLFAAATADRLLDALEAVLTATAEAPATPVSRLPIMSEPESERLRDYWHGPQDPYPDVCVQALVDQWAERTPGAPAVLAPDGAVLMTFGQLAEQSDAWAVRLCAEGVGPEVFVGVCLPPGPELFVALLAILKAGGAYVPFDPAAPAARLGGMIEDCGTRLVLVAPETTEAVRRVFDGEILALGLVDPAERRPRPVPADPENLAYMIYTSGSTGKPKGVQVTHRGLMNYLWWAAEEYGYSHEIGAVLVGSVAYDIAVTSLFHPLIGGRGVVVLPGLDPVGELGDLLRAGVGFSVLKATPGHIDALCATLAGHSAAAQVGTCVVGGEELRGRTARAWYAAAPGSRLINEYGPTETVVGCSIRAVGPDADGDVAVLPIGRPIANTRMYVLDEKLRPVPVGVAGELYIAGDGVARGYWNRSRLTAERFLPDPLSSVPGQRMYRTGDAARFLDGGELEFLGRTDFQVKIRGYRVELGEVEAGLTAHPQVREAAAVAVAGPDGNRRLIAYAVPHEHSGLDEDALREFLTTRLPEYMVPSATVLLDRLPLTGGGKLDRAALPVPARSGRATADTPTERLLAGIWADRLRLDAVGVDENFFELGGDSLLAIGVAAACREAGLTVFPKNLLDHQDIRSLAMMVDAGAQADPPVPSMPSGHLQGADFQAVAELVAARDPDRVVTDVLALTPTQVGMLFQSLADPASYAGQDVYRITGPFQPELFASAWRSLTARHDALRSLLMWEGVDEPIQAVLREVDADVAVLDLSAEPDPHQAIDRLRRAERRRPFGVDRAPAIRLLIVRTGEAEWHLVLGFHHALVDGWSLQVLWAEALRTYLAATDRNGNVGEVLPDAPRLRDYADWRLSRDRQGDEGFWRDVLGIGIAPCTLPGAGEGQAGRSGSALVRAELSEQQSQAVLAFARARRVPVSLVLQAAWGLTLGEANNGTAVYGLTLSGRADAAPRAEEIVGMLMYTVPVRLTRPEGATVGQWLADANSLVRQVQDRHSTPLRDIQRWIGAAPRSPLFESVFLYENFPDLAAELPAGLQAVSIRDASHDQDGQVTGEKLLVDTKLVGGRLVLDLVYRRDTFDAAGAGAVLDRYRTLVTALVEDADRAVADLVVQPTVAAPAATPTAPGRLQTEVPSGSPEALLLDVWRTVLEREDISTDDDFFDLGGDSYLAIKVLARIREAGHPVEVGDLLRNPTVKGLARRLGEGVDPEQ
jgi:amino acid adenylation domain-containing protein